MTVEAPAVFLMSDIVGSTRMWAEDPAAMGVDLAVHDELLGGAIDRHAGTTIARAGDSFAAVFDRPDDAVAAAVDGQRALAATDWRAADGLRVRMAVHLGVAQRRGDGWYGAPLNETARMMAAAHGGQIVVSDRVADLLRDGGPRDGRLCDTELVDLGEHHLRDLDGTRRLFQVAGHGLRRDFPSLRSMGSYLTTLPAQRTTLIGREDLVGEIRGLLLAHRLVSLLGPAGVGKTRVAIEVAGRELAAFSGGVYFVDLAHAATGADVVAAMVSGVRAPVQHDQPADRSLASHLAGRPSLLVVDTCEHVVDEAAAAIDGLLNSVPEVRVLATSREALGLAGERAVAVPSLAADGTDSAGARLLVERALALGGGARIDASDLGTVAEIARRLDGIPLAIELAAAQLRTFSPAQVLGHLRDRFRLLRRGQRQAPERQRTLEAAVAWSYDLLDAEERRVFRRLSVCAGPFTLGTAARLLDVDELAAAEIVDEMANKSLLVPIHLGPQPVAWRHLETLREFGRRELAAAGEDGAATAALEAALLPSEAQLADWRTLANEYIAAPDAGIVAEDATRRDAALRALAAGRFDAAGLLFSSCAFRDHPGELENMLRLVAPLVDRRDELDEVAWRAAAAAKLLLERYTRRYEACVTTALRMIEALDVDDPARDWFDLWRCALMTAVAPEFGIAQIDAALPGARNRARPPHDWTLSQMLSARATGLAVLRRVDDAREAAAEALCWAPVGRESRDQVLALFLWLAYSTGDRTGGALRREVEEQRQQLGLAELSAAPVALCGEGTLDERAARLVGAARRRPPTDIPAPFLIAFAWLAVEEGDPARAAALCARTELYDSSTQVGLLYVLARIRGWTDENWASQCDAAIQEYLHADQQIAVKHAVATLAAEVEAWERRLAGRAAAAGSTLRARREEDSR